MTNQLLFEMMFGASGVPSRVANHLAAHNIVVTKLIGAGASGVVFAGEQAGRAVGVKQLGDLFDDVAANARRALREIRLLRNFRHDNVLPLLGVVLGSPNRETFNDIFLVTPLMHTDLATMLHASSVVISEAHVQTFTYQILRALKYVHSAGVVHRDLKPSNVLVNANSNVRLCDFGTSRKVQPLAMTQIAHTTTLYYRAPEGLRGERHYTSAVGALLGSETNLFLCTKKESVCVCV